MKKHVTILIAALMVAVVSNQQVSARWTDDEGNEHRGLGAVLALPGAALEETGDVTGDVVSGTGRALQGKNPVPENRRQERRYDRRNRRHGNESSTTRRSSRTSKTTTSSND